MSNEENVINEKITPSNVLLKPFPNKISNISAFVIILLSFFLVNYHIFSAYFGQPDARMHRSLHITILLVLAFIYYPIGRKSWDSPLNLYFLLDLLLILLSIGVHLYTVWDIDAFLMRTDANQYDIIVGVICLFLVLEAARRVIGWIMSFIALIFLFQTLYSDLLFGIFYGPPMTWKTTMYFLFMRTEGVYGTPLAAMSSYIILFVIFGSILAVSGGGKLFMDIAFALTGNKRGGPAGSAVVASALFGTISGSAVANVVTTGSFTIPLMKERGYTPTFAAAVEAIASSGGQIMPPVMGATAFIIAEFLKINYIEVVIAAAIPAFLYFFSIFMMIVMESYKLDIAVIEKDKLPPLWDSLKKGGHLFLPLFAIVYFLLRGFTVMMAGFWAIVVLILLLFIKKETRISVLQIIEASVDAAKTSVTVGVACAAAGIIVGAIQISGVGVKLSTLIIRASGGNLGILLFYTMIVAFILGMGLPTVAIYITLSAILIPAVIKMGVYPLAAHLFVFYYGVLGFITPPVCVASFAAAGIAGSDPMKTGFASMRIGIACYIVPFIFAFNPVLLCVGSFWEIIWALLTAMLGVTILACGVQGWFFSTKINIPQRILLSIASIVLIIPGILSDIIGLTIILVMIAYIRLKRK